MKLKFAALLPLLLAPLAAAQNLNEPMPGSLAYLDEHYGFRDLKFEQLVATCGPVELLEDDGNLKFYRRKGEPMEIGGVPLTQIEYGFYKGKFASVTINTQGKTNAVALLKYLEKYYGPGRKSPRNIEKYYWFGKKVLVDCAVSADGEKASSGMWSKPLQDQREADAHAGPKKDDRSR